MNGSIPEIVTTEFGSVLVKLIVTDGVFVKFSNFNGFAIALILASEKFEPEDYIHNYDDYLKSFEL